MRLPGAAGCSGWLGDDRSEQLAAARGEGCDFRKQLAGPDG